MDGGWRLRACGHDLPLSCGAQSTRKLPLSLTCVLHGRGAVVNESDDNRLAVDAPIASSSMSFVSEIASAIGLCAVGDGLS